MVARRHSIRDSVEGLWVRKFKELGEGAFDNAPMEQAIERECVKAGVEDG